jgi:ATPase subunit of ABC transporter with duplicated ATPase domains
MRARLADVTKAYGAQVVLERASLEIGPRGRVGLVGPNGVGKTTVLRLLAGEEAPDRGAVAVDPPRATAAHLPQEVGAVRGETLRRRLARLTGVAAAERALEAAAQALAGVAVDSRRGEPHHALSDRYDDALARYLALGGGDLDARAAAVCSQLGLGVELDRPFAALSGGEAARASLAAVLLVQADLLLLDEPTNDLDADGLERLERFVGAFPGALVVVSHDREFLDRTVTRIAEIDPRSHAIVEWAGGWSDYARQRDEARAAAYASLAHAQERRRELTSLLSRRRTDARGHGAGAGRRGTHALSTKVRQAQRLLERNPLPQKPYEPWELRLELRATGRLPSPVLSLAGAVVEQGTFRLGPLDLELGAGDRLALTGANGTGKTTLVRAVLGEIGLTEGRRRLGRGVVIGAIGQERTSYATDLTLLASFEDRTGLDPVDARTLLAKFGLGADKIGRPCATLSPGERTRAMLAELQARRVNLLVLDEPTNHLDLEAVEQLEQALSTWDRALIAVSHDRAFLEAVAPTRELRLQ